MFWIGLLVYIATAGVLWYLPVFSGNTRGEEFDVITFLMMPLVWGFLVAALIIYMVIQYGKKLWKKFRKYFMGKYNECINRLSWR